MPKHTIEISKHVNDKIKLYKIKHDLQNVSDVIESVFTDPDADYNLCHETCR